MKLKLLALCAILLTSVSCTENERVRHFGGTQTINLPAHTKLENVTWKDVEMWILTRPMRAGETPETYSFQEKSNWGVMEGTVNIVESN